MKIEFERHLNPLCLMIHVDRRISHSFESYRAEDVEIWEPIPNAVPHPFSGEIECAPVTHQAPALVKRLFAIDGVDEVFLSKYEIHITKAHLFDFDAMIPEIEKIIRDAYDGDEAVKQLLGE